MASGVVHQAASQCRWHGAPPTDNKQCWRGKPRSGLLSRPLRSEGEVRALDAAADRVPKAMVQNVFQTQ